MYLRAAKTEAEDAGIETDGMANSVAELRSEIMRLTGVDIMLDDDNFKSTFQILKEISQVWDQITDVSRANVLELLGGKRGANSVSALITNFQTAIATSETAAGSAGSALRENEKYLDSIEGKISILQSNFESLSAGIIDSGVVKFLLDVVNGLMSVLNALNKVHLLLPAIAGFVTYFAGKKMVGSLGGIAAEISQLAKGASSMSAIGGAISGSLTSLNSRQLSLLSSIISVKAETLGLNAAQKEQILQTIAATTATQGLTTANKGLGSALKLVWKSNPIGIIITAITTAISVVTFFTSRASQASAEAIENANEIIEKYEEAERTYKSNVETIKSVSDRFDELAKGVGENGENVSLTNSEYEEFKSLLKQIVDISPSVVTGYNNEGTAIANYTDLVSNAIAEQEKFIENQRNIKLGSGEELYKGWKAEYKNAAEEAESKVDDILDSVYSSAEHFEFAPGSGKFKAFTDKLPGLLGMNGEEFISMYDLYGNIDAISALYENRDEFLHEIRNALEAEVDAEGSRVYDDDYINKHVAAIETAILSSTGALQKLEASKEALADYFADWVDYQKESGHSGMEWASSIPDDAFDEFQNGIASVVDFSKSFEENRNSVIEYGQAFADAAVSDQVKNIVEMSKGLADGSTNIEEYNKAVNDFSNSFEGDPIAGEMITAWLRSLGEVPKKAEEAAGGIQKAYSTLKDAVEDIKDLDSYYEDAKSGKMSIVDALEAAYKLAEDFGGEPLDYLTDGFMLDAEAIQKMRVEAAEATADLFGLEGAERRAFLAGMLNTGALEDEATAYEKLSDAISKSNGVLGIREDITDGDMDFSDIIDAANKIAEDTGKSITDFIDTDTWTLKVGAIRDAYEELVKAEAAVLDISEDAKKSYIQNRLAEFDNAAKIEKEAKAYDKLKDSISDANSVLSIKQNIDAGDMGFLESVEKAISLAEKTGRSAMDFLNGDFTLNDTAIEASYRSFISSLADAMGLTKEARQEFYQNAMAEYELQKATEETAKAYEELSKAIDNANKIASIRQDFAEGDMGFIDMLDAATQLAEITEKPITEFFDISTLTLNVGALDAAYEQFIRSMIAGAGITGEAADKALQLSMEQYKLAKATEETAKAYDKLHDSISNISELQSYISDANSGEMGITKSIEAAAKMAEKYGGEIRDYLSADHLLDMDKVNTALRKEALKVAKASGESGPEYFAVYKQILAELQKEIAGDTEAFGELSTAINNVGDALSYIEKAASGDMDFTESLEAAIKLAQLTESDNPLQFLNTSDWTLNEEALKEVYDTYVEEMIDAIATNDEEAASLRASADAAYEKSQAVEEVSSAYDKMSNAIGMAGSVSTFLTDVNSGEKTVVEQIEQAISLAEALKDADGNIPDWTEWITSVSDAGDVITWNTEAIRALSDSYIDAAFAGTEFADKNPILIQQIKDSAAAAAEAKNAMEALTKESEKYKNAIEASKNNGGYIQLTADAYKSLTDIDSRYISAIEYQNGILTMNSDRMDEVTASILAETKARAEEQRQLILNSEEYRTLMDLYQRGMLTDPNQAKRLQSLIIEANGYDVLAHEIDAASSAYSKWLNRGTEIDRFDEAKSAFDLINETLNDKSSDIFGQIGSKDFSLAVDFVLGEHVEVDTPEFERAFGIAKKYLSNEAQGAANFYDDLMSARLINANGYLNTTIEEIASKLQISTDLVRTMIDSVNKYQTEDNKIKVTEADAKDSEQSIEELKKVIDDLNQQINDLNTNKIDLSLDESSGDTQEKLSAIDTILQSIQKCIEAITKASLDLDVSPLVNVFNILKEKVDEFYESLGGANAPGVNLDHTISTAMPDDRELEEIRGQIQDLEEINAELRKANINYQKIAEEMLQFQKGNVDLLNRPIILPEKMEKAGWGDVGDGYATLFSSTYTAGRGDEFDYEYDKDIVIDVTPILANGDVLSPEALEDYVYELMGSDNILEADKVENGGLGLVLNLSDVEGELDDAIAKSEDWTIRLHELQAQYYDLAGNQAVIDSLQSIIDAYDEANKAASGDFTLLETDNLDTGKLDNAASSLTALSEGADGASSKLDGILMLALQILSGITGINSENMQINTGTSESNLGKVSSALGSIISKLISIKNNKDITVRINQVTTKTTTGSKISGGGALAWGSSRAVGGRTLVGELGMETVVDPARGIWYTVGEHGAEFVNLPENAIVFNHLQTRQLFSDGNTDSRGEALASGTAAVDLRAKSIYGEKVSGTPKRPTASTTSNKNKKKKKKKPSGSKSSSSSSDDKSALDAILEKYQELNDQLEHLIAHQEFLFDQAENGLDYKGMDDSLIEQARLYREIMSNAQAGINELIAAGAKDTDKQLQTIEETYWDAYRSLYDTLDKINALFVDGLNDKIDGIQKAYKSLKDAAEEYSEYGGITVDTFQSLVDNGVQYLSLLKNANGQYVINKDSIDRLIMAEKEQLAIESALSYINQINTALGEKQAEAVANLTDLTNKISNSTWDAVYAQAALLKGAGLTEEQYLQVIANIDALHALANEVISDTSSKMEKSRSEAAKDTKSALEEILDLTKDLIKYEADEQKKAIEDQIEAYKKIIDLKKESLQTSKDEDAYAKNVAEKTKEIADLQVKIDKLSLDDSREAYAQRASLIEDLKKAQEELADLQGDHSYDAQIDALDKMAEQYEEGKNAEIEAIEKSLSSEEKLYQAAMKRLESGWADIYEQLIAWNTEAGSSLNNEITENWNKAAEAVKRYGSFVKAMDGISGKENDSGSSDANSGNNDIVANGTGTDMSKYEKAAEDAGKANSAGDATDATKDDANQAAKTFVKIVRGQWYIRSGAGKKYSEYGIARNGEVFEYAGKKSGNWVAVNYKGKTGWIYNTGLTMYDEVPKYHAGGIVKKTSDGDEVLALLQSGEMVLDEKKKGALYKIIDFQKELSDRLGTAIGNIGKPLANLLNVGAISKIGANGYAASAAGGIIFNPVINVDISAGGSMSDGDAARFGNRIADIAIERLYEGFNKRGIGNIMSNTMNGRK